jgi:hypothetical protein
VTTESQLNSVTCLQMNGTSDMAVSEVQSALPDMTDFQFIG